MNQKKVAGAAVAVWNKGKWQLKNAYGYSDLQNQVRITDSTRFHIMSITKNFIAVAIFQLIEQGRVDLNAPITSYIKELPMTFDSIRVYHLLNHSSGIPDYIDTDNFWEKKITNQSPKEVISSVMSRPLNFIPGEKNEYSNTNYYLLGFLIEQVSKLTLADYLKANIFLPAKMNSTF